jgi:anti-anti-sigma factor
MSRTDTTTGPPAVDQPEQAPRFTCAWCRGGADSIWVHVSGELDRDASPRLAQALLDARVNARMVVLDLRELTTIDGAGARTILEAAVNARRARRRQVVVRGPAQVQRVLARLGIAERLDLVEISSR